MIATSNVLIRAKKKKAFQLIESGQYEEARTRYIEITRQQPRDVESWRLLGAINGQLGAYAEAISALLRALALDSDDVEAWFNLAQAYNHEGRRELAAEAYREVIKRDPDHSDAHNNLGYVLRCQGEKAAALACYREALRAQPNNPEALANMGDAMMDVGAHDDALRCFNLALNAKPDFIGALLSKGYAYYTQGDIAGALDCFKQMLQIQPENHEAIVGQATVFEKTGDFRRAYALLQPMLEQGLGGWRLALVGSKVLNKLGRLDEAIALLEGEVGDENSPSVNSALVHFELGKLYDSTHKYEQAFSHYERANAVKQSGFGDPAKFLRTMDAMMALFSAEFLSTAPRASNSSARPIFIVGMPRSGTTLVEQILASHPDVYGAGELTQINQLALDLLQTSERPGYEELQALKEITRQGLDRAAERYLQYLEKLAPDKSRVTDKMPHNFQYLGLIQLLFPQARIIHCKRNPMDTCFSIFTYAFNEVHTYAMDLQHLGEHYRKYEQLMDHWKKVLQLPLFEINYEDLVADQEVQSRKLIEFCALTWDDRCLRFYENKRVVNTISYDQVRRPIYKRSIERWRHYEKFLAPLKRALEG